MGISRTHKDKMKVFVIAAACLAGGAASPTPQFFDGVKDFFKGLAGDDAPGEVNGDYEQVPYKTINKTKLDGFSYEIREYPSVKWACTQMTYDKAIILIQIAMPSLLLLYILDESIDSNLTIK